MRVLDGPDREVKLDRNLFHPLALRDLLIGCDIFTFVFMATTVHIPAALLKSVDKRARALGVSRNRLIVRALEEAVRGRARWTPEFLQRLREVDRDTRAAVDEMLSAVKRARRSKEPQAL